MISNKIEDIDTYVKKLYSTWIDYFGKKKNRKYKSKKYCLTIN